jgi:hypothetical protein
MSMVCTWGEHLEELGWLAGFGWSNLGGVDFVAMLSAHAEHTHQDTSLFSPLSDTRVASIEHFYGRLVV